MRGAVCRYAHDLRALAAGAPLAGGEVDLAAALQQQQLACAHMISHSLLSAVHYRLPYITYDPEWDLAAALQQQQLACAHATSACASCPAFAVYLVRHASLLPEGECTFAPAYSDMATSNPAGGGSSAAPQSLRADCVVHCDLCVNSCTYCSSISRVWQWRRRGRRA